MSVKEQKCDSEIKDNNTVRVAQAVLQYGVGAMVDFQDQTLMTAAPEYWKNSTRKIYDERLQKVLSVDYFGVPCEDRIKSMNGIAYARFPEWYFCPQCRQFKPIGEWVKYFNRIGNPSIKEKDPYMTKHMQCPKCKQKLVAARIVTVCSHGHIDDFPWIKWVHCRNFNGPKDICSHPELSINTTNSSSEGLETIKISCKCGAQATLKGALSGSENDNHSGNIFKLIDDETKGKYDFSCSGRHPWKGSCEECYDYPEAKQRGSSTVYFPFTVSSLVIPPYSSTMYKVIEECEDYNNCKERIKAYSGMDDLPIEIVEAYKTKTIDEFSHKISLSTSVPSDKVKEYLSKQWLKSEDDSNGSDVTITSYKMEEYEALTGRAKSTSNASDEFLRESTRISDYGIDCLSSVSLIKKIREVQALIGYSRLQPVVKDNFGKSADNMVSIKEKDTDWYPAYEVRGEGIFLEFDSEQINQWIKKYPIVSRRAKQLEDRYNETYFGNQCPKKITPKFILLHTISHLLIKQLSFSCGYSIASIKERLYCSEKSDGKEMSGILIYTASGDSEGTLGGLVRQGLPDVFPETFRKAIEYAKMCSNDPVCSFSNGQGRDSLNLAACYSCAMIPETSCEEYNEFLDRAMVIGTLDNKEFGFFENEFSKNNISESKTTKPILPIEKDIIIKDFGTKLSELDYSEIWNYLNHLESNGQRLCNSLKENYNAFNQKEKPISNGSFCFVGDKEVMSFDMAWPKSKVIIFTQYNYDEYLEAKNSSWQCFYMEDESLIVDKILDSLEEK